MTKKIYVCDNTIQGVFTAIFDAYSAVCNHETTHENIEICCQGIENFSLFAEYIDVKSSEEKTTKVSRTVCNRMGYEAYESFCFALACNDDEKGTSIYKTIVTAFQIKDSFKIMNMWSEPHVAHVIELSRKARNEFFRWREFLEFRELSSEILYSEIGPVCDIISFLGPHFENRFPNENFMIHDSIRDIFLIHEKSHHSVIVSGDSFITSRDALKDYSEKDQLIADLFTTFTKTIGITERKNLKLQQQLMPLRIQKYKVEFQ